jgi:transposase
MFVDLSILGSDQPTQGVLNAQEVPRQAQAWRTTSVARTRPKWPRFSQSPDPCTYLAQGRWRKRSAGWTDEAISDAFDISVATVLRVRQTYVRKGLTAALKRRFRSRERARRLDGHQEAQLIALACSEPPTGHERWTLRLLADRMITLEYVGELSYETVRRTLKKTNLSLG